MNFRYISMLFCGLLSLMGLISTFSKPQSAAAQSSCVTPSLSGTKKYQVSSSKNLGSLVWQSKPRSRTIFNINSDVNSDTVTDVNKLKNPPLKESANLLQINGCQQNSRIAVPVVLEAQRQLNQMMKVSSQQTASATTITGYPLDNFTTVALPYGWQIHPITRKVFFHSGVDLVAPVGTPVKAIAPGIVVFAKEQGSYGKLVIINHVGGLQTRYAQLETIQVNLGKTIRKDEILGTVGATGQPTSREAHLHFEIRADEPLGWTAKDPKEYFTSNR